MLFSRLYRRSWQLRRTSFLKASLFLYLVLSNFGALGQKKQLHAEAVVVKLGTDSMNLYLYLVNYGNMQKGIITNSVNQTESVYQDETHKMGKTKVGVTSYPSWNIIDYKTGENWACTIGENHKTAVRTFDPPPIDSSSYYSLSYAYKFKKIAGFNCQKMIVVNKITKVEDSMYVCKDLNNFDYRFGNKFGKIDFIVRSYAHVGKTTLIYTVVKADKIDVPSDTFVIPKDFIRFQSMEEYIKWSKRIQDQELSKRSEKK